jgi:hypothetical protein
MVAIILMVGTTIRNMIKNINILFHRVQQTMGEYLTNSTAGFSKTSATTVTTFS